MRKIFLLCLLVPIIGISQNNVVSTFRVFPKTDKLLEFEKALATQPKSITPGIGNGESFTLKADRMPAAIM